MHRKLTAQEEKDFRAWADKYHYDQGTKEEVDIRWHPVIRAQLCAHFGAHIEIAVSGHYVSTKEAALEIVDRHYRICLQAIKEKEGIDYPLVEGA